MSSVRRKALVAHAVVVGVLTVGFVTYPVTPGDVDLGIAVFAMPLLALGLPWSLFYLYDPYLFDDLGRAAHYLIMSAPAVVNVLLHAGVVALRSDRDRTGSPVGG
ncbi:hypothetical protein Aca07nite_85460 [Actinoplanes capillaceus]|uniref:Uncharacterized protein n=1 Tax=Actinoplanes campanulatus TaxID=113559 RepID=A0ABQ3WYA3_9ACTN|nr:hypothetical protein [Actinoplanes capillaceus]GID51271.1 hypothetical protein Aca07nite_85460 [Actinoplanes capillaceus]